MGRAARSPRAGAAGALAAPAPSRGRTRCRRGSRCATTARARSRRRTGAWIASLYGELHRLQPTPVDRGEPRGRGRLRRTPEAGLELLDELRDERALRDYVPLLRGTRRPAAPRRRPGGRRRGVRGGDRCSANAAQRADLQRLAGARGAADTVSRVSFPGHASLAISVARDAVERPADDLAALHAPPGGRAAGNEPRPDSAPCGSPPSRRACCRRGCPSPPGPSAMTCRCGR